MFRIMLPQYFDGKDLVLESLRLTITVTRKPQDVNAESSPTVVYHQGSAHLV